MLVRDMLKKSRRDIITVDPKTGVREAMETLISNKIGCLPVLDTKGNLVGILDDQDIFRAVYENQDGFEKFTAGDLMTSELIIGMPSDEMNYVAGLMAKNDIRYIPIMEDRKMIGLISPGDVVKAQMKHIEIENRYLKMYMEGTHLG
jgi:CBS domain-containing protein